MSLTPRESFMPLIHNFLVTLAGGCTICEKSGTVFGWKTIEIYCELEQGILGLEYWCTCHNLYFLLTY